MALIPIHTVVAQPTICNYLLRISFSFRIIQTRHCYILQLYVIIYQLYYPANIGSNTPLYTTQNYAISNTRGM